MTVRRIRLEAGEVWVSRDRATRTPSRRVIEVIGTRVCYSSGGEQSRWCEAREFRAWIRERAAVRTRPSRPRTMILRPENPRAARPH